MAGPLMRLVPIFVSLLCVRAQAGSGLIAPGATLTPVHEPGLFLEGPTWDHYTARLYYSALSGLPQLFRWDDQDGAVSWLPNSQGINGTFLANDGRLLAAQGDTRKILSFEIGLFGPLDPQTLGENLTWQPPNDLCQTPAGHIYFTTPAFTGGGGSYVYHRAPNGVVTPAVTDMTLPNGVIASNDGDTLYVADSTMKWWRSYPIAPDGSVGAGALFFNPNVPSGNDPDGMTIDEFGNLYLNGRGGVWIVSPAGQQLDFVAVPEFNTNATFGGIDGKTLFITTNGKLYSLAMTVRGSAWRGTPAVNMPPNVTAGPDLTLKSHRRFDVPLSGTTDDDGVPDPPANVTARWYQMIGPGEVTFDNETSPTTTATFPGVGTYVLRLIGFDGLRSAFDEVTVDVEQVAVLDDDADVDQDDFGVFQACITGPGEGPPAPECQNADLDEDGDVDQSDYGLFQRCYSGAGVPANPDCANG